MWGTCVGLVEVQQDTCALITRGHVHCRLITGKALGHVLDIQPLGSYPSPKTVISHVIIMSSGAALTYVRTTHHFISVLHLRGSATLSLQSYTAKLRKDSL